jgi:hypothetical protein
MKTNVEKQVAAFDQVLGHCNAFGQMYNPSKHSIKVTAMTCLLTSARESVQAVDTAKSNVILAINERQKIFEPLPAIATRIVNSVTAADASPQLIADIKLYRDKFRSKANASRVKKAPPDDSSKVQPIPAGSSRGPLSQLDFNSKIRNFSMIIELLKGDGTFVPNETDLSIDALTTMLASLREKHKAVRDAQIVLSNARASRNIIVCGDEGILGVAKRVKKYVSSVYGATSKQFHQVNSISLKSK